MRYNGKTDSSTIPGRLHDLGFERYADYLASSHWQDVRRRFYVANPARCGCGSKAVALHHLTYERLGAEQLEDLEAVCRKCHRERHGVRVAPKVASSKPRPKRRRRKKRPVGVKPTSTSSRGYQRGEVKGGSSRLTYHP